jgi:hypothetical protein
MMIRLVTLAAALAFVLALSGPARADLLEEVRERQRAVEARAAWKALSAEARALLLWPYSPRAAWLAVQRVRDEIAMDADLREAVRADLVRRMGRYAAVE